MRILASKGTHHCAAAALWTLALLPLPDTALAATCTSSQTPVSDCTGLALTGTLSSIEIPAGVTVLNTSGAYPLNVGPGTHVTSLIINGNVSALSNTGGNLGRNRALSNDGIISSLTINANARVTTENNGTDGSDGGIVNRGTITTFTNYGYISGRTALTNRGTIGTLTNLGDIPNGGWGSIRNDFGSITTLNNLQGATGALTIRGSTFKLPTFYNIIIHDTTHYGKLLTSVSSFTTTFGISSLSNSVTATTYASVLDGFTVAMLGGATKTAGTFGSYSWMLVNSSGNSWDLVVTDNPGNSAPDTNPNPGPGTGGNNATPSPTTDMLADRLSDLTSIGVTTNPVFSGGTLTTSPGNNSAQAFTVGSAGGTITSPTDGTAQLSGVFSGTGALNINGAGMLAMVGNNTYSGGTNVLSGVLSIGGDSPLGTGAVFVDKNATLIGTGTINGALTVAGVLKPGHSPGYLATKSTVTMNSGSIYQQDIAGPVQASTDSPAGATGYYSHLKVDGAQFVIQPGTTLTPRLANLFTPSESGYGSPTYIPVQGDQFRIITADGGVFGRFSTLTQPAELSSGTQFIAFYNLASSNSVDLAVIPTSYTTTLNSKNANTRSIARALDEMVNRNQSGTATRNQDPLLYAASAQTAQSLAPFSQSLAGEVYGATLAVVPQTTLRVQQAVMSRLGDTMTTVTNGTNTNKAVWGDMAYQRGQRNGDDHASGFSNNLYQLVFGIDAYSMNGTKMGGGLALSNTGVNARQGTGTVQQGALFLYGKLPVEKFIVDGMTSIGLNSSSHSRNDPTGLSGGLKAKAVRGNDALVSLGISRPVDFETFQLTPYARATWQGVYQSSFGEGATPAALNLDRFYGSGVRGVIGVYAGSKSIDPMNEKYTYRAYMAVGADTSGLINPGLNASLAGISTTINTPNTGAAFLQAGLYGTARFADNAFAYMGVSGEARSGAGLGSVNLGARLRF